VKYDTATLKRWRADYIHHGYDGGFRIGHGTRVRVTAIESERSERHGGSLELKVTAEFTAYVSPRTYQCERCKTPTPMPSSADALVFILRNHDGERLVFAAEEDVRDERDCYPVEGWRNVAGNLLCPTCAAAFVAFMGATQKTT
jgi:hypothetical protein